MIEPNSFKVGDRVVNTAKHDPNYIIKGQVVGVRLNLIEVLYQSVLHIEGQPWHPAAWPVGTVGRSAYFLWRLQAEP